VRLCKVLSVASLSLTLCLAGCSTDDRLVGEWQSSIPQSVHLKISKGPTSNDGFRAGFSHTLQGQQTYNRLWLIRNESTGDILCLSAGAGAGSWLQSSPGMALASAARYKIIGLTSDKLMLEWDNAGKTPRETYEFHRVN
jgi:hypothetical protein